MHPDPIHRLTKQCLRCGASLPLSEYQRDSQKKDGLRSYCRRCTAEAGKARYQANAAAINAQKREYHQQNRERALSTQAQWRERNRERKRASDAAWMAANPDKRRASFSLRRARMAQNGGTLSAGIVTRLHRLQRGMCACCGQPLGEDYHLDHIVPLALGGANSDGNVQLLRARCNLQKRARDPVEFMQSRGKLL